MHKKILLLVGLLAASVPAVAQDCVVLLHGLAKSDRDMRKLERRLSDEGFTTVNHDYASTSKPIEELSTEVVAPALTKCGTYDRVHFVTHSMGGIVVRHYLSRHDISGLGRVVMLAPPNNGSEVIDSYRDIPGFETFGGPSGLQLGTGAESLPKTLGVVEFDLGIIAGTRSVNLVLSSILPGSDDGKVTVESTRTEGMNDHLSMPVTHPFMMKNGQVIEQVIHYLENGRFDRARTS